MSLESEEKDTGGGMSRKAPGDAALEGGLEGGLEGRAVAATCLHLEAMPPQPPGTAQPHLDLHHTRL